MAVGEAVPAPPIIVPVDESVGVEFVEGVEREVRVMVRETEEEELPAPPEDTLGLGVVRVEGVPPPPPTSTKVGEEDLDREEHRVGEGVVAVVMVTERREGVKGALTVGASGVDEKGEEGVVEGVAEELPTPLPPSEDPEGLADTSAERVAREGEGDSELEALMETMGVSVPPPPPPAPSPPGRWGVGEVESVPLMCEEEGEREGEGEPESGGEGEKDRDALPVGPLGVGDAQEDTEWQEETLAVRVGVMVLEGVVAFQGVEVPAGAPPVGDTEVDALSHTVGEEEMERLEGGLEEGRGDTVSAAMPPGEAVAPPPGDTVTSGLVRVALEVGEGVVEEEKVCVGVEDREGEGAEDPVLDREGEEVSLVEALGEPVREMVGPGLPVAFPTVGVGMGGESVALGLREGVALGDRVREECAVSEKVAVPPVAQGEGEGVAVEHGESVGDTLAEMLLEVDTVALPPPPVVNVGAAVVLPLPLPVREAQAEGLGQGVALSVLEL